MTATTDRRAPAPLTPVPRARRGLGVLGLVVALVAGGVLVFHDPQPDPPPTAARVGVAAAWPHAQRADLPGNLPDGPVFTPGLFLDARVAVGTAPSPDGRSARLLLRAADGALRELRRRPLDDAPEFGTFAVAGDQLVWTESSDRQKPQVWAVDRRSGAPARRLTSDTGNAVFYGSEYDLVVADGRVHWAAAAPDDERFTEIRSVALTGGPVRVRKETGTWALTAWPWLTDGADQAGTRTLRNLVTNRDTEIGTSGAELTTCSPAWCRVMVMNGDGLARIDVMHPDGSARQRIAGGTASAAITDVAVLDSFEVLAESTPDSDLTGTQNLLVHDIRARRTVDVAAGVDGAFSRAGVLWWSTGDQDSIVWHTLDLRTV